MKNSSNQTEEIQLLLGLRSLGSLLQPIRAEQFGTVHPWFLPNIGFFRNALSNEIIISGTVEINKELFDTDGPTFFVHHQQLGEMESKQEPTEEQANRKISSEEEEQIVLEEVDKEIDQMNLYIKLEEVDEVMNKMMVETEDLEQIMNQNFLED